MERRRRPLGGFVRDYIFPLDDSLTITADEPLSLFGFVSCAIPSRTRARTDTELDTFIDRLALANKWIRRLYEKEVVAT